MPSVKSLLAAVAFGSLAHAKTIEVTAKKDNTFDPDEVEAAKGDVVEFHFEKGNHSVVAGNYEWPCSPLEFQSEGSFFSGFIDTDDDEADDVFRVTINATEPIAFYSSVGTQCPDGMVGIINPSKNETLKEYKEEAANQASGVSPRDKAFGGEVAKDDGGDDDDSNDDSSKDDDSKDDDKDDDSSSDESNSSEGADDEDGAGAFGVPVMSLLAAVGVAFFMA